MLIPIFIFLLIVSYLSSTIYIDLGKGINVINYFLYICIAFLGIGMIVSLSDILSAFSKKNKIRSFVQFISDNTLTIMCVHIIFNGTLSGLVKVLLKIDTSQMPLSIALMNATISFVCSLIVAIILQKKAPVLIGIIKK